MTIPPDIRFWCHVSVNFRGESMDYNPDDTAVDRIFETRLYNYFLTTDEVIGDHFEYILES